MKLENDEVKNATRPYYPRGGFICCLVFELVFLVFTILKNLKFDIIQ